jgi:hypothetical protein
MAVPAKGNSFHVTKLSGVSKSCSFYSGKNLNFGGFVVAAAAAAAVVVFVIILAI